MIGALGLGMIGGGVIFIWAGWKDRKVGDFFATLKGGGGPPQAPADPSAQGDFAPGGGDFATSVGPVLPPIGVPR